jgi:hypothetical protein
MGDMEQYEAKLLKMDAQLEHEEAMSQVTPSAMQVLGNARLVSIDTRTAVIMGVKFHRHAGDYKEGDEYSWFPELHVQVNQWDDSSFKEYIHVVPYEFEEHGKPIFECHRYVAKLLNPGGYLDNQKFRFNT